jgi:three-Cys-motif partner protein
MTLHIIAALLIYQEVVGCPGKMIGRTFRMAAPKETVWEADPHTFSKHAILRHYLAAWFPIISRYNQRIVYYDGFAGPGRYAGGEEGSPLIALNVAKTHSAKLNAELVFIFVESRKDRYKHLENEIEAMEMPSNFKCYIQKNEFEVALRETLDDLDKRELQIAPTFAFIDPFGITGLPFKLIERLLMREKCETFITFMNNAIKRFVTELPDQVNSLIGQKNASKEIAEFSSERERVICARELYQKSLQSVAKFVRFFEMKDLQNRTIYDLFFATNHPSGHVKMKEAMWKIDQSGEYSFSDGVNPDQATLFSPEPGRDFAKVLWSYFRGRTVSSCDIMTYTNDKTAYLEKHAKAALKLLEAEAGLNGRTVKVDERKIDGSKRRKNSYSNGTRITFLTQEERNGL